ncbi:DUF2147 domain-containing protein [Fulvimarina sp. 2208YS6-2-32]|uniref:DUF2147 domain-containing protein n=1 Tax=Fulvimarina uroteuthidis TaxID=3098149 RepID=A0ABU5I5P3_9HYPH|nr:DUF2147 domain-containing protein [Fulvimarina sp. 2208YS6-2-32]MDY8110440.1 DUF2147 domain-containing protein [Fulvimarina sp. 2208YS6-2-32]
MSQFVSPSRRRSARIGLALAALLFSAGAGQPQSGLVGTWTTSDGGTIAIESCGSGYCAVVASGPYKGAAVAEVSGTGPTFDGRVHDPINGKSYPGSLTLNGQQIALKGCIMEVFCKTVQNWNRAG